MKYSHPSGPKIRVIFYVRANFIEKIELLGGKETGTSWEIRGDKQLNTVIDEWMKQYCLGCSPDIALPLGNNSQTVFAEKVLTYLPEIPYGTSICYSELAKKVGCPKGARAVGSACGKNPFPLVVPCHRVLAKGDVLGGFSCGIELKSALLKHENIYLA